MKAQSSYLSRTCPLLTNVKGDAVWMSGLNWSLGYLSMAIFFSSIVSTLMSSSSFLTELFDPGHWPMRFFHSASDEVQCCPIFGFICFASHPPCSIPCFPMRHTRRTRMTCSPPPEFYVKPRQDDWMIMEATCFIVIEFKYKLTKR